MIRKGTNRKSGRFAFGHSPIARIVVALTLFGMAFSYGASKKEDGPNGHKLVPVAAGEFTLGEKDHARNPLHVVKLHTFKISDTETTNAQFVVFVKETGYVTDAERLKNAKVFREGMADWAWVTKEDANWRQPMGADGFKAEEMPEHPVTQISGADAEAYCKWVGGRLPTLDEWEIAARAGVQSKWPWGDKFIAGRANIWNGKTHKKETDADRFIYTAPVRSYAPNAWGLYDVIGNVFEYCSDLPKGETGRMRSTIAGRGGSWWCSKGTCSAFNLVDIGQMTRRGSLSNQGFRVVFGGGEKPAK